MIQVIDYLTAQKLYNEGKQVFYIDYHSDNDEIAIVDLRHASKEYIEHAWQKGSDPYGIDKNTRFFIIKEEK